MRGRSRFSPAGIYYSLPCYGHPIWTDARTQRVAAGNGNYRDGTGRLSRPMRFPIRTDIALFGLTWVEGIDQHFISPDCRTRPLFQQKKETRGGRHHIMRWLPLIFFLMSVEWYFRGTACRSPIRLDVDVTAPSSFFSVSIQRQIQKVAQKIAFSGLLYCNEGLMDYLFRLLVSNAYFHPVGFNCLFLILWKQDQSINIQWNTVAAE